MRRAKCHAMRRRALSSSVRPLATLPLTKLPRPLRPLRHQTLLLPQARRQRHRLDNARDRALLPLTSASETNY